MGSRAYPITRPRRNWSTSYIFPNTAEELTVLNNVVRTNPEDATAQYLLGTLDFSRGLTDSAIAEWRLSRKVNPQIPVLDASLGLALLHEKHDPERALSVFREGLQSDATNVTVYLGADQALSRCRNLQVSVCRFSRDIRILRMRLLA